MCIRDRSCTLYKFGAIAAAVIASVYFIVYHCCLKPRCLKQNKYDRYRNPQVTVQGLYAMFEFMFILFLDCI